jgi:tetratricopeptide (TPR) repeat protein
LEERDLAERYLRDGHFDEAIALYERLAKTHPEDDSVILGLAWANYDAGRIEDAVGCFEILFEKELKRTVFTGFAYDELVKIYRTTGDHHRLIDICRRAVAAQPGDILILCELGDAYLYAGSPDQSISIFKQIVEKEPDDPAWLCRLGSALLVAGDLNGAEKVYDYAAELDPQAADLFYSRLYHALIQTGLYKQAEAIIQNCITLKAEEPLYRLSLGEVLILQKRLEESVAAFEEAVALNSSAAGLYYNRLGHLMAAKQHHSQAAEAFKKAIQADSTNPFPYLYLADSYLALGLTDLADDARLKATNMTQ